MERRGLGRRGLETSEKFCSLRRVLERTGSEERFGKFIVPFLQPLLPLLLSISFLLLSHHVFLIYSSSLSHHFQQLPVYTQPSETFKREQETMGIGFQLFQCHCCHEWMYPLWACLA